MATTRREFLAQGLTGVTLLAAGESLPGFMLRTAEGATVGHDERVLVIVQLSGGNDGLNTVIPYRDDAYHKARPTLRISPDRALKLTDDLGLHPDMTAFKRLHDDGLLKVVSNVGYPNPDRSHFRSMDIWHTAMETPEGVEDGWLGRVVDRLAEDEQAPPALHLDSGPLPLALRPRKRAVPSIRDISAFSVQGDADALASAVALARDSASDDLLFVQRMAVSSCANARRIEGVAQDLKTEASYPEYGLAQRLKQIANLIGANFGPRIYYTSMDGFDTHSRQVLAHGPLLRELASSISAFHDDLKARKLDDRVAIVTFSEFGRRVSENGSQGTDHGVAAPMFVVGSTCKPGIIGGKPDLENLVDGDLKHEVDFRQVYAGLLDNWLGVKHESILGARYKPLSLFA